MTPDEARELLGSQISEAVIALVSDLPDHEREAEHERAAEDRWPEFMRVPTAAKYVDTPEESVWKLLSSGKLARIQEARGHRVLIERAELDRVLREWRR